MATDERPKFELDDTTRARSQRRWRGVVHLLLDWVYPPRCVGCDRVDARWCAVCQRELAAAPITPLRLRVGGLAGVVATGEYVGALRTAILALKFNDEPDAALLLGERMARVLARTNWSFDMVIPVPLYLQRQRERGYNQSELLGEAMAHYTTIPMHTSALHRVRATRPQVGQSQAARLHNLQHAFRADPSAVMGRRILLLDDVCTTGATLRACADVVRAAGATVVYGLTAAAVPARVSADRQTPARF